MYRVYAVHTLWRTVQRRTGGGSSTLLLAQLLLKLGEFMHGDDLLLIHNLLHTLDLLNLPIKLVTVCNKERGTTYIVHKHRLDTVLQSHSAGVTSTASTTQLKHDNTILESLKINITTVLLDGGTDSRLEKLLDHADNLIVILVVGERVLTTFLVDVGGTFDACNDGLTRCHGLRDDAEDLGLDVCPVRIASFRHGNEVGSVEDGGDTLDIEEFGGEGRWVWRSES